MLLFIKYFDKSKLQRMSNKIVFLLAVAIFSYISFLHINANYLDYSNGLLRAVQELITIPILIGQVVILLISITRLLKEIDWKLILASLLMLASTATTISEFL